MNEPTFLMSDLLGQIVILLLMISPIAFIAGIITIIASRQYRKVGIKIVIASVIAFIIGFSACLSNI